jgi:hypothetical protein
VVLVPRAAVVDDQVLSCPSQPSSLDRAALVVPSVATYTRRSGVLEAGGRVAVTAGARKGKWGRAIVSLLLTRTRPGDVHALAAGGDLRIGASPRPHHDRAGALDDRDVHDRVEQGR